MKPNKKAKKKKGAKLKWSPEVQTKIVQAINGGNDILIACQFACISKSTFYSWMASGENGKQPYAGFLDAVSQALAQYEVRLVVNIDKQAIGRPAAYDQHGNKVQSELSGDWRALAWLLERKFPERWGRRDQIKIHEAEAGEDFRPDGSYEKMLDFIHELEEQGDE